MTTSDYNPDGSMIPEPPISPPAEPDDPNWHRIQDRLIDARSDQLAIEKSLSEVEAQAQDLRVKLRVAQTQEEEVNNIISNMENDREYQPDDDEDLIMNRADHHLKMHLAYILFQVWLRDNRDAGNTNENRFAAEEIMAIDYVADSPEMKPYWKGE